MIYFNLTTFFTFLYLTIITYGLQFPEMKPAARILTGDPTDIPIQKAPAPRPDISSRQPWRLEIDEKSLLIGTPGQKVNVRIRLTNLERETRDFSMIINESGQGPFRFIESQSQSNLVVRGGEFQILNLNLRIPETIQSGHRNIIRVTALISGSSTLIRIQTSNEEIVTPNFIQLDFSFLVAYSFSDTLSPRILSTSTPVETQCANINDCAIKNWISIFLISDDESGIRSIETDPYIDLNSRSRNFVHNPYILGDPSQRVRYVLTGNCCDKQLSIRIRDGFGNEVTRHLTPPSPDGESSSQWGLSGAIIAIIIVSILLLVLIIGGVTAVIIIRQRRAESINEMRRFPTPAPKV